jgi:hypothetical protein
MTSNILMMKSRTMSITKAALQVAQPMTATTSGIPIRSLIPANNTLQMLGIVAAGHDTNLVQMLTVIGHFNIHWTHAREELRINLRE